MYPSTTGRFSATIGYVAPTPNHVRVHRVQQSEIKCPKSSLCRCHEQNVRSRAPSRAQTPNPSNPTKGTPKGETHKGGPPLCPRNNTPTPLPTTGPKTRSRNPPSQPLPPGSAPHTATSASRTPKTTHSQLCLVIQRCGHGPMSRRSATAPSSFWHTVCP